MALLHRCPHAGLGRELRNAAAACDAVAVSRLLRQAGEAGSCGSCVHACGLADQDGFTALHRAAASGGVEVIRLLLAYSAALGATTARGDTPLLVALAARQPAAVQALLSAAGSAGGAGVVNVAGRDGVTPLVAAAAWGEERVVKVGWAAAAHTGLGAL